MKLWSDPLVGKFNSVHAICAYHFNIVDGFGSQGHGAKIKVVGSKEIILYRLSFSFFLFFFFFQNWAQKIYEQQKSETFFLQFHKVVSTYPKKNIWTSSFYPKKK